MESLLPYYERELTFLRRLSHDFARQYPKVAGRLLVSGETCEDPHIERLIESFAFLTGRIHKKLDDEFPEITDSLLQVVYPQYLRPFPSVSIAHFDGAAAQLTSAARVPRGTMLNTRPVRGVPCRFSTAYDVDILPVRIAKACFENVFDSNGLRTALARSTSAVIRLDVETISETVDIESLELGKLRLFLNGEPSVVALIREAVFSKATGVWISTATGVEKIELPAEVLHPVGFAAGETLLAQDARSHHAYHLMLEYFVFPDKFNFIDIDLSALGGRLPPSTRAIEIRIGLTGVSDGNAAGNLLDRVRKDNFVLGCTPVVNLFSQPPEPIRITDTATAYPVVVDSRRPRAYEVYDITRVSHVQQGEDGEQVQEFKPFYSIRHGESQNAPARYWHVSYLDDDAASDYTMEISLVDAARNLEQPQTNTLSLELLCTNRDLPSQLPFGLADGDLSVEGGTVAKTIRFLRKPTQSYRFPRGQGAQWRLISHLALNHLSLADQGIDALKEILTLYDITRSIANSKQISGIVSIENRAVMARIAGNPFPTFARGLEIRIVIDETHYAGIGLFMFAQILDRFFGLYVHTNSFTQLVIVSNQSGQELIKCPARNGESILA
ncbi:MAG: type secretion system protein ImpG [Burkholderiales bacterium]|jgi:type VI secretion system protein ImpG